MKSYILREDVVEIENAIGPFLEWHGDLVLGC